MINANQSIFSKLIDLVKADSPHLENLDKERYIKTGEEEKKWLKELKIISKHQITPGLRTGIISYDSKSFLTIMGWEDVLENDDLLTPIELNGGLVTAILSEMNIPLKQEIDPNEIINEVISLFKGTEGYAGHDYSTIKKYFQPFVVYHIDDRSAIPTNNIIRISCYYLSRNSSRLTLPFSPETNAQYQRIILEGSDTIPFENLLHGLVSVHWHYVFLDTYRCIERIFSFPYIDALHQALKIGIPLLDFSSKIENTIGWWPREDQALEKLFKDIPSEADKLLRTVQNNIYGNSEGRLSDCFYKIRNSIVHFRPATENIEMDERNWDLLVRGSLMLIEHFYKTYHSKLQYI